MIQAALLLGVVGIAIFCVGRIYVGFRTGEMQLISRGLEPFFFRKREPILFWSAAAFNGFLAACAIGSAFIIMFRWFDGK